MKSFDVIIVQRILNKVKRVLFTPLVLTMLLEIQLHQENKALLAQAELSLVALCRLYPRRIRSLFGQLDLEQPGLEPVKMAVAKRDWVSACEALVSHYQTKTPTSQFHFLQEQGDSLTNLHPEKILDDTFTFQQRTAQVPRQADGNLNWSYQGHADDREWAWFLNRHYHLLTLLAAYQQTHNKIYIRCIDRHLQDWITSSWSKPKQWWAQWRGREVALRVIHWVPLFYGSDASAKLSPAVQILMLSSLLDHARYLRRLHAWGANWLCREMSGLATVALCWPEFKSASQWLTYANDHLLTEINQQIYPDGVHKELTSHYHRIALQDFQRFADLLRVTGAKVPPILEHHLERMWNYLAYSLRPSGYSPLNNDSDRECNCALIQKAAIQYQRPDWLYIATNGQHGELPAGSASAFFPWAGQAILRSGWDRLAHWAFFDAGPLGINYHVHRDKLHLSVSAYGRDLLVDSGRYRYVRDQFWSYFRESASHNVILVDGKGQRRGQQEWQQPESTALITPTYDFVQGTFDSGFVGVSGKVIHSRALLYVRGKYWVVVDQIESDRPHLIQPLWHFHPDCTVTIEQESVVSVDPGQGNLRIVSASPLPWRIELVSGQTDPVQGWWSREYNHIVPNTTAIYTTEITTSTTFAWVLYPAMGKVPKIQVNLLPAPMGTLRLTIAAPGEQPDEVTVDINHRSAHVAKKFTLKRESVVSKPAKTVALKATQHFLDLKALKPGGIK